MTFEEVLALVDKFNGEAGCATGSSPVIAINMNYIKKKSINLLLFLF